MKNVLFATTALVAFAGAAAADVGFSGALTAGYNDVIKGGLFWEADLDVTGTIDLGDGLTATLTVQLADFAQDGVDFDADATVEIAYDAGSYVASLAMGDLGDKGASEYYYVDRSGMDIDVENHDGDDDARALVEFGNFGAAIGCGGVNDGVCDGMNIGGGATFGAIALGVGYDDGTAGQSAVTAASVDATFGALAVGVSYATGTKALSFTTDSNDADATVSGDVVWADALYTETSIGADLAYDINDAISVGAYYASNAFAGDSYGVSGSYSSGAFAVSAYYDVTGTHAWSNVGGVDADGDGSSTLGAIGHANTTTTSYGVDANMDLSSQLTAFVGVNSSATTSLDPLLVAAQAFTYYAGIEFAVSDAVTATVSFATADAISGPEFNNGITAQISGSF